MNILQYKGRVIISRLNSETLQPIADSITELTNSGTNYLWELLCYLLYRGTQGDATDDSVKIPGAIDIGYFKNNINTESINDIDEAGFTSILSSGGNLFVSSKLTIADPKTSKSIPTALLEVESYFTKANFTQYSNDKGSIYIVLKDKEVRNNLVGVGNHILAVVNTGSTNYDIEETETQAIKWQLSFQNGNPESSKTSSVQKE